MKAAWRRALGAFGFVAVAAGVAAVALGGRAGAQRPAEPALHDPAVTRGTFRKELVLNGRLTTAEAERLRVPIVSGWRTTLKWMIDEGARVEPGDVVARLDTSSQASGIASTESALLEKRQQRELLVTDQQRNELEGNLRVAQAELDHESARIDAAVPVDTMEARRHQEYQLALERAKSKLDEARLALDSGRAQKKAEVDKLDLEIAGLAEDLARAQKAIDAMTVRAGRAGIVVHEEHPWFGRKLRVGETVQSTFPLIRIPDLSTLVVEAFAPESEAGLVRAGQRVRMWLDAFPSREFTGKVAEVAQRGEERPEWGRTFYFRAKLALDAADPSIMRPGMSVRCELLVEERADALLVPLEAAELRDGRFTVRPVGREPVALRDPAYNENWLAVATDQPGLAPGDRLEVADASRR